MMVCYGGWWEIDTFRFNSAENHNSSELTQPDGVRRENTI